MPARSKTTKPTPDPKVVAEKMAGKPPAEPTTNGNGAAPTGNALLDLVPEAERATWPEPFGSEGKDKAARTKASRTEFDALKAWFAKGKKGKAPAAPNYAAVVTKSANGGVEPKPKRTKSGGGRRSTRSERGQQGMAARKAADAKRANLVPTTEDELVAWIKATLKRDPNAEMDDERVFIRWVENRDVGRARFEVVFNAIKAGEPVPPARQAKAPKPEAAKPAAKKAPVKKATTAKKAPAKKAAPQKASSKKVTPTKRTPNPLKDARKSQTAARANVRKAAGR